jgi:glycosyltransferase involved in cell wall biosynthesis
VKPILFVTGHAPAYRVGALAALHAREGIELALFGGSESSKHGGAHFTGELPFPSRRVRPLELAGLAASSRYRAVICPTGGRLAPLATWAGARRAGSPLILWASLWAHPRSAAHALSYLPLRHLYQSADAVVTYGPHVSAYVRARGARNVHIAPQSVDNDFWSSVETGRPNVTGFPSDVAVKFLFVGRPAPEKGLDTLLAAWRSAELPPGDTVLVLAGAGSRNATPRVIGLDALQPEALREVYAACDVLVIPSVPTRTFREPWGLVVNEAMNRGLAVIATDAVGAAAGGLVRDGGNGLVVEAGDPVALAEAISQLARDGSLRASLGAAGRRDVKAYSHEAWAEGFSRALSSLGLSEAIGSVA